MSWSFMSRPVGDVAQQDLLHRVTALTSDPTARSLARAHGLDIVSVAWEDCARSKASAWGPCISDLTLMVRDTAMPLVRQPNFTDFSFDVPLERLSLVVGNEAPGRALQSVSLRYFLENICDFTDLPRGTNLINPYGDSHAVASAQACFLPVLPGEEAKFNVAIYNYQSTAAHPAVLAIVASSKGTSVQLITNATGRGGQRLFFNLAGQRASFIGERLRDFRLAHGAPLEGEMTAQEQRDNALLIVQIPLVIPPPAFGYAAPFGGVPFGGAAFGGAMAMAAAAPRISTVDEAILSVGAPEGPFPSLATRHLQRDTRYPLRLTVQFYKATQDAIVDAAVMGRIATQIATASSQGDFWGSLVTHVTARPTEPRAGPAPAPGLPFLFPPTSTGPIAPMPVAPPVVAPQPYVYTPAPGMVYNCDECRQRIHGVRYHCTVCPDYDMCVPCEGHSMHACTHPVIKVLPTPVAPMPFPVPTPVYHCPPMPGPPPPVAAFGATDATNYPR